MSFANATNFNLIFNILTVVESLVVGFFVALCLTVVGKKFFQIIQQSNYEKTDFKRWLKRKGNVYKTKLPILFMLTFLVYLLISIALGFLSFNWIGYLCVAFLGFFTLILAFGDKKHKDKIPLKITSRIKRLVVCYFIFTFIFAFLAIYLGEYIINCIVEVKLFYHLRFSFSLILVLVVPNIVILANQVAKPFEKIYSKKYYVSCENKLNQNKNLIKIAVTGSYGKTTVKNLLHSILSVKYKVLSSPKSFNTPLGVCRTVNDGLDETFDVFICEMGARNRGDILELCNLVNPNCGIITGVCAQHIDTFKTIDNVVKTKAELIEFLSGKKVVVSADNEYCLKMGEFNPNCQVITAGLNDQAKVFAQDVEVSEKGSSFVLNINGRKLPCKTKLLGEHNVSNICLAVALAVELGLSDEEICQGIANISPIEHRLCVVENDKGFTIIDDSYNCNVVGYKVAIDVCLKFSNSLIVITPGLVEMGDIEEKENYNFGKYLSGFAKKVVLVGSYGAYNVRLGLLENGFNFNDIIMCKTLDEAKEKLGEIVSEGDVVLFENDLPDRFL